MSWSMMAYVYLVLGSQVQASSTMVGNLALAVDAQHRFKNMFISLINKDLSFDIKKYLGVVEKLAFTAMIVGTGIIAYHFW